MQLRNTASQYGLVTKMLHWSVAVLVAIQFAGGIAGIGRDTHASVGLLLLALVATRWAWRMTVSLPDWAATLSLRERHIVHLYELVIYAMLFAKPITGLLLLAAGNEDVHLFGLWEVRLGLGEDDSGRGRGRGRSGGGDEDSGRDGERFESLEDLFEGLHFWTGVVLVGAVALHIGLVLRHQLLLRDGLLRRMWIGRHREGK